MKKIYLSLIAAVALTTATAQNFQVQGSDVRQIGGQRNEMLGAQAAKSSSVGMSDLLLYFQNKHDLRNSTNGYPGIICGPAASYTATNFINKVGCTFENPGTVAIRGFEGLALSHSTSASPTVQLVIQLFQASGTPLMPTGSALASFTDGVSGSTLYSYVGGTFTPVQVTGPYAIVMSCISTNTLDKIVVGTTNAKTSTATVAPPASRFGEQMGFYGTVAGNWASTSNIIAAEDDREACIAPYILYSFSVAAAPATSSVTCNTSPVSYNNTSSGFVDHRQYNVNKLCAKWAPFANTALYAAINPDSVFTWNFGDNTIAYGSSPTHFYNPSAAQAPAPTYTAILSDNLIGKVRPQLTPTVAANVQFEIATWNMKVTICNVGLTENSLTSQVAVYPNPATDKVTVYVNNAKQDSQIQVMNALGQVVITRNNLTEKNDLNTESLTKGIYFVRVGSGKDFTTTKLVISK
ncbi:MAG: T9SS type A sorting domain-containing protein [Bacteroidia bacterium]|nr:T9SS type A sorting domain-containing protein [Bacteroidia bacterium]